MAALQWISNLMSHLEAAGQAAHTEAVPEWQEAAQPMAAHQAGQQLTTAVVDRLMFSLLPIKVYAALTALTSNKAFDIDSDAKKELDSKRGGDSTAATTLERRDDPIRAFWSPSKGTIENLRDSVEKLKERVRSYCGGRNPMERSWQRWH